MTPTASEAASIVKLSSLTLNENAQVSHILGGRALIQRLTMLGIRPGATICLLHGPGRRGAVLRVGGTRVALGHGVIDSIMVTPLSHGRVLEAAAE